MQLDHLWRRAHSYLFITFPCFSNPVSNQSQNPWRTVFAEDLSWFIRPNAHGVNKEWGFTMPVVVDCCLRRLLWLIFFFLKKGHYWPDKAFTIRKGYSRPDRTVVARKRAWLSQKDVLFLQGRIVLKGYLCSKKTNSSWKGFRGYLSIDPKGNS